MGGPDMGGLILYGACNGGPGIVRNVPNPAPYFGRRSNNSSSTANRSSIFLLLFLLNRPPLFSILWNFHRVFAETENEG